jgi:hypothetical protein
MKKTEKTRTHFTFRVDTWTPDGESIVEHVAGVEDYQVALATYRAACERWPGTPITLRRGARVIEDSRRLRVVSSREGHREISSRWSASVPETRSPASMTQLVQSSLPKGFNFFFQRRNAPAKRACATRL